MLNSQNAKFLIGGGIEFGGDPVYELQFTNGESQDFPAGQGGFIEAGGQFHIPNLQKLFLRASVGYKFLLNASENANTRLTRVPVTLLANWKTAKRIRFGLGVTAHTNTKVDGDGFVPDLDFETAIGPRLELAYRNFALTYTILKYTDEMNETYDASSIGLAVTGTFGKSKTR